MKASKLQNLEFQYVELAPEAGNLLAEVPVRIGLSLNGTGLKQSQVDAIAKKTPGLIIEFKQGGFLGVIAGSPNDCLIGVVQPGSAAENAGLIAGDIIVQINDQKVETFDELREEISKYLAGDVLKIVFVRGDHLGNSQTMETPLTLGRQPSPAATMPR
jgi:S1-C subfamily serine protease